VENVVIAAGMARTGEDKELTIAEAKQEIKAIF